MHPVRDGNAPDSWLSSPVAVGGPDLRFHDLRRTAATLLLSQNVHPKIVADLLGHASVAMTLVPYRPPPPPVEGRQCRYCDRALLWGQSFTSG
ncbi:MAG: tyrosine-type recombinase/integrase [Candidatus Dormibacteria bacterium]